MPNVNAVVQRNRINILRAMGAILLPLIIFTESAWEGILAVHESMEILGGLMIIAGVIGRFWAILYSGGRKNAVVVRDGPYSICRHPLYLFSIVAVCGFALHTGSMILLMVMGGGTAVVMHATARSEEAFLLSKFGPVYADYMARVPRIWPDLSGFRSPDEVTFSVATLRRNAFDAAVFLAFLPLAEFVEYLHGSGLVHPIRIW